MEKIKEGLHVYQNELRWRDFTTTPYTPHGLRTSSSKVGKFINKKYANIKNKPADGKRMKKRPYVYAYKDKYIDKDLDYRNKNILNVDFRKKTTDNKSKELYMIYEFDKGARVELAKFGFATARLNTLDDPVFIFLNSIKGGNKYRNLINGTNAELINNNLILDIFHDSSKLLYDWWTSKIDSALPPIAIYGAPSSKMNYPGKFNNDNKSFNDYWVDILADTFKMKIRQDGVAVEARPYTNNQEIRKQTDPTLIGFDDQARTEGDYQHLPGVTVDNYSQRNRVRDADENFVLVPQIAQAYQSWQNTIIRNQTFEIKNMPQINRWRFSNLFEYDINLDIIIEAIENDRKILIVDDNVDTGTTIWDLKQGMIDLLKIPEKNIIAVAQFDAKASFTSQEKNEVRTIINDILEVEEKYGYTFGRKLNNIYKF